MHHSARLFLRLLYAALGGAPMLFFAFMLARVWIEPMSIDDGGWVRIATSLVLIEFLLLHSGAFMAAGPAVFDRFRYRLAWFAGFSCVYGASLIGIAWWSEGSYVFWMLLGILISRLAILVVMPDKKGIILMLQRSAIGMVLLVLTAIVTLLPVPELGLTEAVRTSTFGPAMDLVTEYPQRFIAWGIVYFSLMSLVEMVAGWNMPDWTDEEADRAWERLKK